MKWFLMFIFVMLINNIANASADSLLIGEDGISGPVITYNLADLITGIEQTLADGTVITEVIITANSGVYYLEATGTLDTYSRAVGIDLKLVEENGKNNLYLFAAGLTNTCAGVNCESCKFTRDMSNEIDGCYCARRLKDGLCNHTISQGFAGDLINNLIN